MTRFLPLAFLGSLLATLGIIVVVAPPPPLPPPSSGTSCLARAGPVISLSGVKTSPYVNMRLADNTKVDASGAYFMTSATNPVILGGGSNICYVRGETLGALPPSTAWSPMHDTYAFKVMGIPNFTLEGVRQFDYGDGITIKGNSSNWTIRGVYFKYMRDDCIENDWVNSGTVEDSFFDGCFQGFSSRPYTGTQDGSTNGVVVKNSLFRLQHMDKGYTDPGHGGFFKWSEKGPMVSLHNNIYRVDEHSQHKNHSFGPPAGKLKDCSNNVMIWLGPGPFPEQLPSCYRVLTGAEGLAYWNEAVARWKAAHPATRPDVSAPIVSMHSPAGDTTLTGAVQLTATAVDDRDVVGVEFKLDGQRIGAEVSTESPLTKFTLTWDSRSIASGTHTLTATARDAAGNVRTSAGITVTVGN